MTNKKPYILRQWPEQIVADPLVIERLQRFADFQLSIEGEMYKALQAEAQALGKHKEESHAEDQG